MRYMIATDTGGTFTDVAVYDRETDRVTYGKSLTNYRDLIQGVIDGMITTDASLNEAMLFKHGTTHVINTLIERTGAKTALVTTKGFADSLEIGRGNRPVPFALQYQRTAPLVNRNQRYEVAERIDFKGEVLQELNLDELEALAQRLSADGIESVAVSFVNSFINPQHEERAVEFLKSRMPDAYVTCGTKLTREWFEYERTSTAVANAYVGSRMSSYVETFSKRLNDLGFKGTFYMMGSNGGVMSEGQAVEQPVSLVESGPIGGCIGASAYARELGISRVIAFDMGGTTAKCALVEDGKFDVQPVYYVGGYDYGFPLKTPVLDIVEVGAGGGSIASVDATGRLIVGPRSAGSEPGPVAFGRGGTEPTVTDANLVLGRIGATNFLKGRLKLNLTAAEAAVREKVARPLGYDAAETDTAAQGILDIATATMCSAIKEITIERGHDVREFTLMAFGGGGPLFASVLARELRIPKVIIPPHPGNFSTLGMLTAGARFDLSRMVVAEVTDEALSKVSDALKEMEVEARQRVKETRGMGNATLERVLEMRYRGQKHTIRIDYEPGMSSEAIRDAFTKTYRKRYGHANANNPVEVLEARLGVEAELPRPTLTGLMGSSEATAPASTTRDVYFPGIGRTSVPVWRRETLSEGFVMQGPAIVEEFSSTTVLLPGDTAAVGRLGEIHIDCGNA